MKTNLSLDLKPRIELGRTLDKNLLVGDRLVIPMYYKVAESVDETSSKVQESQTYNEAINNAIHGNR